MKTITPEYLVACIVVMAVTTYALRMVTLVLVRKKLTGKFIYSFLTYIPYGVLAAMVFPDIFLFTQTGANFSLPQLVCAALGAAVAIVLSLCKRGLITVSVAAVATVFVAQQVVAHLF